MKLMTQNERLANIHQAIVSENNKQTDIRDEKLTSVIKDSVAKVFKDIKIEKMNESLTSYFNNDLIKFKNDSLFVDGKEVGQVVIENFDIDSPFEFVDSTKETHVFKNVDALYSFVLSKYVKEK